MYPNGKLEIKGAKELEKVIRMLPRKMGEDVLVRATRSGATIVKNEIKKRAPVGKGPAHPKYGRLKNNIKTTKIKQRGGAATIAVHTGKAYWGSFLEFGTSKMSARPFFRPAFDSRWPKALDKIGERLGINLEKVAKQLAGRYRSLTKAQRRRMVK